jgi:hypothetical protein
MECHRGEIDTIPAMAGIIITSCLAVVDRDGMVFPYI